MPSPVHIVPREHHKRLYWPLPFLRRLQKIISLKLHMYIHRTLFLSIFHNIEYLWYCCHVILQKIFSLKSLFCIIYFIFLIGALGQTQEYFMKPGRETHNYLRLLTDLSTHGQSGSQLTPLIMVLYVCQLRWARRLLTFHRCLMPHSRRFSLVQSLSAPMMEENAFLW